MRELHHGVTIKRTAHLSCNQARRVNKLLRERWNNHQLTDAEKMMVSMLLGSGSKYKQTPESEIATFVMGLRSAGARL